MNGIAACQRTEVFPIREPHAAFYQRNRSDDDAVTSDRVEGSFSVRRCFPLAPFVSSYACEATDGRVLYLIIMAEPEHPVHVLDAAAVGNSQHPQQQEDQRQPILGDFGRNSASFGRDDVHFAGRQSTDAADARTLYADVTPRRFSPANVTEDDEETQDVEGMHYLSS